MNLLGHTYVALALGEDEPAFVLGSVLPDLAPMAGVRLDRELLDGPLRAGVRCHVRTDAAFHQQPSFVEGSGAIRQDLVEQGLPSGAARAVGHAGWELLLDGTLVGSVTETAFHRALDVADRATPAVPAPQVARWRSLLAQRDRLRRLRYDDPGWVAGRLHLILSGRRHLGFSADQVPAVARTLRAHVDRVTAVSAEVLAATADATAAR